jgi:hypothetical protein
MDKTPSHRSEVKPIQELQASQRQAKHHSGAARWKLEQFDGQYFKEQWQTLIPTREIEQNVGLENLLRFPTWTFLQMPVDSCPIVVKIRLR